MRLHCWSLLGWRWVHRDVMQYNGSECYRTVLYGMANTYDLKLSMWTLPCCNILFVKAKKRHCDRNHQSFINIKDLRKNTATCNGDIFFLELWTSREKPLHTDAFPQKNRFHRAAFTHFKKSQFYVFDVRPSYRAKGLHPALENRNFWRWTIILRERVAPDLVKSQFYTSFISRETVVPDVSKWIKSQFYTNSWTLASDVKKSQFSHSYCRLTFMPRLHLNFQNHDFTQVFDGWPSFRAKGLRRAPPNLHFATCLDVRPAWCRGSLGIDYWF